MSVLDYQDRNTSLRQELGSRTAPTGRRRVRILGVPVDCVDMDGALEQASAFLETDRPHAILAVNPEKVMAARANPTLLSCLEQTALLIPDGIGVVLGARLLHSARFGRVPGSELMPALCALAARTGRSVFLFGASEEVNAKAAEVLAARYPGLKIAGRHNGYVAEPDMPGLIETINRSGADILFVALGSPRQEMWIAKHLASLNVRVCQGVGGTFDVLAGKVKRAPLAFRKIHMEWLYRLLDDPRRVKRQKALPIFAAQVVAAKIRGGDSASRAS